MNKFKKIGLTALAASLVSVSAHAGEMSVAGSASINVEGYAGENLNGGSGYSMGNQLTFSGSGELDNGMTVSLSFILDQNSTAAPRGPRMDCIHRWRVCRCMHLKKRCGNKKGCARLPFDVGISAHLNSGAPGGSPNAVSSARCTFWGLAPSLPALAILSMPRAPWCIAPKA